MNLKPREFKYVHVILIFLFLTDCFEQQDSKKNCEYANITENLFTVSCTNKNYSLTNVDDLNINKLYTYSTVFINYKNLRNCTQALLENVYVNRLIMNYDSIEFISSLTFSKMLHLQHLNLDYNQITARLIEFNLPPLANADTLLVRIRSNFMHELNKIPYESMSLVSELDMASNLIEHIDDDAFENFENLKFIDLSSNRIENISSRTFSKLTKLKQLVLECNRISLITAHTFTDQILLTDLDLSSNFISIIEENSFKSLKRLDLGFNRINSLSDVYMEHFDSLLELNLESNYFAEFSFELASNVSQLQALDISLNSIERVNLNGLYRLNKLTDLDLSYLRLFTFVFDQNLCQSRIEQLKLNNNRLVEVKIGDCLMEFSHLLNLDLSFNVLSEFERGFFSRLKSIVQLTLNNNLLRSVSGDVFAGLIDLETLIMSENLITTIEKNAFCTLNSLKTLDLSHNKISLIEEGSFDRLESIEDIDLSFNKLESIKATYFKGINGDLTSLDLSHNLIMSIETGSFESLATLRTLDVSFNGLVQVDLKSINGMNLKELNFKGNEINQVTGDYNWLHTDVKYLYMDANKLINGRIFCLLAGYVEILTLQENGLTTFIVDDHSLVWTNVSNYRRLKSLDLSRNRIDTFRFETDVFESLVKLDLSDNLIECLNLTDFQHLHRLVSLILANNKIKHIDRDFVAKFPILAELNLRKLGELTSLGDIEFKFSKLQILDLSENRLARLGPVHRMLNLTELNLANLVVEEGPNGFENLNLFPGLKKLDLSLNNLTYDLNSLNRLSILTHLTLKSVNNLTSLQSVAFRLHDLRLLDLSCNQIRTIRTEDLSSLVNLLTLNLSFNQIEQIDADSFANLSFLRILDLAYNRLKEFFFQLSPSNLRFFSVKSNRLLTYSKSADSVWFYYLESLDLSFNKLRAAAFDSFFTSENILLSELYLSHNEIELIDELSFQQMTSLLILDLNSNRVSRIDDRAFLNLKNLQSLNLSENNLTLDQNELLFSSLFQLSCLNLSHNQIEHLRRLQFANLYNLHQLDVRSNRLKSIDANAFDNLNQLNLLDLSDNRDLELVEKSLAGLDSIKDIFVSFGQLTPGNLNYLIDSMRNLTNVKTVNDVVYYRSIYINYRENDIDCLITLKFIKWNLQLKLKSDYDFSLFLFKCYSFNLENFLS